MATEESFTRLFKARWQPISERDMKAILEKEQEKLSMAEALKSSSDTVVAERGIAFWQSPSELKEAVINLSLLVAIRENQHNDGQALVDELIAQDEAMRELKKLISLRNEQVEDCKSRENALLKELKTGTTRNRKEQIHRELADIYGERKKHTTRCAQCEEQLKNMENRYREQANGVIEENLPFMAAEMNRLEKLCQVRPQAIGCQRAWQLIRGRVEKVKQEAESLESMGNYKQAAELYERMKVLEEARRLFRLAGEWERAGEISSNSNPLEAAQDYKEAACRLETSHHANKKKLAELWEKAEFHFRLCGEEENVVECHQKLVRYRGSPDVTFEIHSEANLVCKKWCSLEIIVQNTGYGVARKLRLKAAGPAKLELENSSKELENPFKEIAPKLTPQKSMRGQFSLWPEQPGRIKVSFSLSYEDNDSNVYQLPKGVYLAVNEYDMDEIERLAKAKPSLETLIFIARDQERAYLLAKLCEQRLKAEQPVDKDLVRALVEHPELSLEYPQLASVIKDILIEFYNLGQQAKVAQAQKEMLEKFNEQAQKYIEIVTKQIK